MNPRIMALAVAILAAVVAAGGLAFMFLPVMAPNQQQAASSQGPVIGGPFELVDDTGKAVTDEDFRGDFLLVFFGFTHCPDVCPTTLGEIAATLDRLGPQAGRVQPLFISVDPARDTPAGLREYIKAFDPRIVGLTGTPEQIKAVTKDYGVYYAKADGSDGSGGTSDGTYSVNHSSITYLMGPDGAYLRTFSYGTSPEKMAEAIAAQIAESG